MVGRENRQKKPPDALLETAGRLSGVLSVNTASRYSTRRRADQS